MALNIVLLVLGMILLVKGADFFVDGSSRIARAMRIPPLIIGLTLVSVGTSMPEASVSIFGAIRGMNDMSIGNVVGSNIFNTLFIIGVSALVVPLVVSRDVKRFDIPIMIGIYCVLIIFGFAITPLKLDIFESVTLLLLFVLYTAFLILRAKRENKTAGSAVSVETSQTATPMAKPENREKQMPMWLCVVTAVVGLAGIILGGDVVVNSASDIAKAFGMSEALVGLTIVAVGTSLPELVTSVVASVKKENDIAIGNVIGSNIFNIILILGLSSTISNLVIDRSTLVDMLVMLGSGVLIMAVALCSKKTGRIAGAAFVLLYIGYLAYIIVRN